MMQFTCEECGHDKWELWGEAKIESGVDVHEVRCAKCGNSEQV